VRAADGIPIGLRRAAAGAGERAGERGHLEDRGERRAPSGGRGRLAVELADPLVPGRQQVDQAIPEGPRAAGGELLDRHSLLLDPGVIAEIEDALALAPVELAEVVGRGAEQVAAERLGATDRVEAARKVAPLDARWRTSPRRRWPP